MDGKSICTQLQEAAEHGCEFQELLEMAMNLTHQAENCFHWTGIYELYPDGMLRLGPFVGAPTDHVFIGVGEGVCGTAVKEKRNINIPNVHVVENYLACSQETTSELVVLIRSGDRIFGQIDIDSHEIDAFSPEIETGIQEIADWLAQLYQDREEKRVA